MGRKKERHQIKYTFNWLKQLTATVLAGSLFHSMSVAQVITKSGVELKNQATYTYEDKEGNTLFGSSSQIGITPNTTTKNNALIDPFGQILGCNGEELDDYTGFTVGLFELNPSDPTGTEPGKLINLTPTDDIPNNNISQGIAPNITNVNNYAIANAAINGKRGIYNFLFDTARGQTDVGRSYILVVNPPRNSSFPERRIRIEIQSVNGNILTYIATSLDGQPITATSQNATQISPTQISEQVLVINDAERVGLSLALRFNLNLCSSQQIKITKTGDRATAEPGETVIYRLSLRNTGDSGLDNLVVTDQFPIGFKFLPESVRGQIGDEPVAVTTEANGSNVTFRTNANIPIDGVINIAYAAKLTPDAVRGSGRNSATVNAQRDDNDFAVKDGPATHLLRIRPGITSNCGTIIGRVFVDKNFDGEQQAGEPGVPNAVIFLENGNRISTDPNGLYSVKNVLPGKHTGVLDLQSLPGYTLAPNVKFKERNSQSRLVNLEPGGMVRMNFAVTPSFGEEAK
ncbi:hypothetical protein [Rivularia sp. UHCC 0363]|uniref:hypothetical protein n=1 Tax=Rivularia sp. UHCC 0363 TaxID=3110244 RepID=UPI002B20735E|nr:hypothetical protein [Rivularia sp. UHCC 0363]MEA5598744.1 hypothetical protein [Rivularia sp. UHCC 0363]